MITVLMRIVLCALAAVLFSICPARGENRSLDPCPRPAAGSVVTEPAELASRNGLLQVNLAYRNHFEADGVTRYCYVDSAGDEAPVLRLKPGDLLVLHLRNELRATPPPRTGAVKPVATHMHTMPSDCGGGLMDALSTNLHFHGLTVPPTCHQDDVLNTFIPPGDSSFEYRFQIPPDEAPGLYWYHPHIHGFTSPQVLGGASGAMIVEGLERANSKLAGLPERTFVIRDQNLANPDAQPVNSGNVPAPIVLRDVEGDALNTGTGGGKPAKDLSINFVPVPYPEYPPAVILIRPSERQLWRVLNSCAITYLNLQVLANNVPQPLGVVALDGIPTNEDGKSGNRILWESHILLPPAGRAEFIVKGPPMGATESFITRSFDTGPAGENDPTRPLATLRSEVDAPEPHQTLDAAPVPLPPPRTVWLGDVKPVTERKLYFSETQQDPKDPASPTTFYITVDGEKPAPFDPAAPNPNITVRQGDVEDWVIENRTQEVHAFHIHQTHFILIEWNHIPVYEPFLRDTVNVAYWDGKSRQYPSVKLRMDFRDPNIVGTFLYHCHLLEHEDGGMMGTIRVLPHDAPAGRAF
jgi:FtsP/CotA-like multicopper oxidase with cupredoxin domain